MRRLEFNLLSFCFAATLTTFIKEPNFELTADWVMLDVLASISNVPFVVSSY